MKPHAKNAETATATTAPPVVFLAVRLDVLPPKVTLDHVREYLAAFIEDRHPVLLEHQIDAMGEVKAVVVPQGKALAFTPEAPPRPARNAKGEIELEFDGVGISAMPYDRLMQSLGDIVAEADRRGARCEVNLTHPAPPVEHVEIRFAYKGV